MTTISPRPCTRTPVIRALMFFIVGLSCSTLAYGAPVITALSPSSGAAGTAVTITGTGFGSAQGSSTVRFNGTTATASAWSSTSITVTVPVAATTGNVVVRVSNSNSNGSVFTVTPAISSLSVTSGAVSAPVTISGASFGASQGTSTVRFNGTLATVSSWSTASIVVSVPAGASSGNVVVRVNNANSNGVSFTVVPTAVLTAVSPSTGAAGAMVTLTGSGFGASQGSSTVRFNGVSATPTAWADGTITAPVPATASSGNVVVRSGGVDSNPRPFTVVPAPTLTTVAPTQGTSGTLVTLTGTNFGATQGTVTFNGTSATVVSWSATTIQAQVPAAATSGLVRVGASGVTSNGQAFTVIQPPQLTSLAPTAGAVGATVTLTGSFFGAAQGPSTVSFAGTGASVVSWSDATITATVPPGAASGSVLVRVNGLDSSPLSFSVLSPPTLTSVSPTTAAVGSPLFLTGQHFGASQASGQVRINGLAAPVVSWSDTRINAVVPPGALSGPVSVFAHGVSSNGVLLSVAPAPSLTTLSPPTGPVGSPVVISGTQFGTSQAGGSVRFGSHTATVTQWTDSSITATVPRGGNGDVVVRAGGVSSNSLPFTLLTTLSGLSGQAQASGAGYSAHVNAVFQRPERNRLAPRGLEVQLSWYHSGSQLFAVDRFLISDIAALPTSGLHDAVVGTAPLPWRVVVKTRESLGEVPAEGAFVSCNSDRPYPGQSSCTTDELPPASGSVIGEATSELIISAAP